MPVPQITDTGLTPDQLSRVQTAQKTVNAAAATGTGAAPATTTVGVAPTQASNSLGHMDYSDPSNPNGTWVSNTGAGGTANLTGSDSPSSSSHITQGNSATSATTAATTPAAPASADEQYLMSKGFSLDQIRAQYSDPFALNTYVQQSKNYDQTLQLNTDAENSYADQRSALEHQYDQIAASTIGAAGQAAFSANPYAASNSVTAASAGVLKDNLAAAKSDALAKFDAALNALKQGDAKTASSLLADISASQEKLKTDAANIIHTQNSDANAAANTELNKEQLQETKDKNDATTAQQNAVDYQNALKNEPLGNYDLSKVDLSTPAGLDAFKNLSSVVSSGLTAGYSPKAILSDLKSQQGAQFQQQKINVQLQDAQIKAFTAQANAADKQSAAIDAQTLAGADPTGGFLSAITTLGGSTTKAQNTALMNSVSTLLSSGNVPAAKSALTSAIIKSAPATDQKIYSGLQQTANIIPALTAKINALAPGEQGLFNGTVQQIAARLGQNPDPKLQELGTEFGHLQAIYTGSLFGNRAATANSSSIFANLFPNTSSGQSLSLSDMKALTNTANDTLNSFIGGKLDPDTFQKVYGSGGVLGTTQTWQGYDVGSRVQLPDGRTGTVVANGIQPDGTSTPATAATPAPTPAAGNGGGSF